MVATVWIVRKSTDNKEQTIDGIETVVINNDNLDTEQTTIADAEAALQAAGFDLPSGYFDSAVQWNAADPAAIDADGDLIACGKRVEIIA